MAQRGRTRYITRGVKLSFYCLWPSLPHTNYLPVTKSKSSALNYWCTQGSLWVTFTMLKGSGCIFCLVIEIASHKIHVWLFCLLKMFLVHELWSATSVSNPKSSDHPHCYAWVSVPIFSIVLRGSAVKKKYNIALFCSSGRSFWHTELKPRDQTKTRRKRKI